MKVGAERKGAILATLVGAGYFYEAVAMPDVSIGDPLGPRLFPMLLGIFMTLLGGSLVLKPAEGEESSFGLSPRSWGLVLLLGLYGYAIPMGGYPLCTFLFLAVGSRLLGERSWLRCLGISAIMSALIFLLFTKVLDIPLPVGFLAFSGG